MTCRFWRRHVEQGSGIAFDGPRFANEIDLAIEMLHWAPARGFTPTAVLFDSYILTEKTLRWLRDWKLHWVSRIKAKRRLIRKGQKFSARHWALLSRIRCAPKLSTSVVARLPDWGEVRLIKANNLPNAKPRFLFGSNLT